MPNIKFKTTPDLGWVGGDVRLPNNTHKALTFDLHSGEALEPFASGAQHALKFQANGPNGTIVTLTVTQEIGGVDIPLSLPRGRIVKDDKTVGFNVNFTPK